MESGITTPPKMRRVSENDYEIGEFFYWLWSKCVLLQASANLYAINDNRLWNEREVELPTPLLYSRNSANGQLSFTQSFCVWVQCPPGREHSHRPKDPDAAPYCTGVCSKLLSLHLNLCFKSFYSWNSLWNCIMNVFYLQFPYVKAQER